MQLTYPNRRICKFNDNDNLTYRNRNGMTGTALVLMSCVTHLLCEIFVCVKYITQ